MTKLTKEQIEKERAEFEEYIKSNFDDLVNLERARNGNKEYMSWDTAIAFRCWLARTEMARGE